MRWRNTSPVRIRRLTVRRGGRVLLISSAGAERERWTVRWTGTRGTGLTPRTFDYAGRAQWSSEIPLGDREAVSTELESDGPLQLGVDGCLLGQMVGAVEIARVEARGVLGERKRRARTTLDLITR
jgi:hypothetical protein